MTSSCKPHQVSSSLFLVIIILQLLVHHSHGQTPSQEGNTGFTCNRNNNYPCQAYAFYTAQSPDFLDLASIADLFSVSRLMISTPSNISSPSSPLVPNQPLFVPLPCSCNTVNATFGSISYANISYTIKPNDTFFLVSTIKFQNLTTYPSVEVANPNLVATNLSIGDTAVFPVFCKCPDHQHNRTTLSQNYMISYVVQPSDNVSSIASRFGSRQQDIIDVNGNGYHVYDTIFVPVARLPVLKQPAVVASPPPGAAAAAAGDDRTGTVRGLGIGLGVTGLLLLLLILVTGFWVLFFKDRLMVVRDVEQQQKNLYMGGKDGKRKKVDVDVKLMADCLDKYRVFGIEELIEATDGFDENCLIQGSVYKGSIDGEVYAIKKMKWNAYEELKILQKVNHGNLVKLEGFCIDSDETNCYLVYEYVGNGSLYSWLHDEQHNEKLNWKTRLRIAIDIANGLQYIHEHTRPRVVHKDIKSSNILLDSNMRAKIANFGLAKSGMNAITMHIVGTQGYIAPEYLADGVVSMKMDVFSFGVVLLELISGKEAIDEDEGKFLWESAVRTLGDVSNEEEMKGRRVEEWVDKGILRETLSSMESLMGVMSIAIACLHKEPTKRPSIVDIVYALCKSEDTAAGFDVSNEGIGSPRVTAR